MYVDGLGQLGLLVVGGVSLAATLAVGAFAWARWRTWRNPPR
jgi:hypothetical protein